jgi:hypothetical protein
MATTPAPIYPVQGQQAAPAPQLPHARELAVVATESRPGVRLAPPPGGGDELVAFLADLKLAQFAPALQTDGYAFVSDLDAATDDELAALGLKTVQLRRLRRALISGLQLTLPRRAPPSSPPRSPERGWSPLRHSVGAAALDSALFQPFEIFISYRRSRSGDARVISDCHFRKTATEYDRKPGIKWLSCTEK